jgi:DNA-binding response OmpR family regulator
MPNPTADHPTDQDERYLRHGRLLVDLTGFSVTVGGRDVPLTFSEFLLFKTLVLRQPQTLDRETLTRVLNARQLPSKPGWGDARIRSIDIHMSRIRRKFARAGYDCITTMRYVGYRFVPPAEGHDTDAPGGGGAVRPASG